MRKVKKPGLRLDTFKVEKRFHLPALLRWQATIASRWSLS